MAKHTASDVADWFLMHNRTIAEEFGGDPLTNMKLQKLLYYAQGAFLGITGQPLFSDEIEAWKYGPVVPAVYQRFNKFGNRDIEPDTAVSVTQTSTNEETGILRVVYDEFGQFTTWKLSAMTREEAPWRNAPPDGVIEHDAIREYFQTNYVVE